jgi:endoglucanase
MHNLLKYKNLSSIKIALAFFILFSACSSSPTDESTKEDPVIVDETPSYTALKASGTKIVNSSNKEVLLRGVNLGQWLVMEGFMSGSNGNMTPSAMKRKLAASGKTRQEIETYFKQYRDNFITKADIDYIASKGFNCIRLPLHYELFLTAAQREKRLDVIYSDGTAKETAYTNYKNSLQSWVTDNTMATSSSIDGFQIIDNLVTWCKANNIYIILDMHTVPGTAGDNTSITDEMMDGFSYGGRDFFYDSKNREALYRIWDKISERYKDESTICMYDLINEPHNKPSGTLVDLSFDEMTQLKNSYNTLINTIRANNDQKIILLQGGDFGNDYQSSNVSIYPSGFTNATNLVYNFHRYRGDNSKTAINSDTDNLSLFGSAAAFRTTHNVPLFCGETGLDDDYIRLSGNFSAMKDLGIGWALWTYKTHTDRNDPNYTANRVLLDVGGNNIWDDLNQWSDGSLFENIKYANCSKNPQSAFWTAIDPTK